MEKQEDPPTDTQISDTGLSASELISGVKAESKRPREGSRRRNLLPSRRGHRCSTYGCNRSFINMQDLINHVSVHYKPTQSMQDKKFMCSVNGCSETVNSMQDLMTHLKVHYKPNRYFKCENCMQHFRTHRSLFKHLHVCSDNTVPTVSQTATMLSPPAYRKSPMPARQVARHTSVIQCIKKETPLSMVDEIPTTSVAAASTSSLPGGPLPSMSNLVSQASKTFPILDPSLFVGRLPGPSQPAVTGSYLPYVHPSTFNLPQATISQRLRPFLGNQGLPASNAMWKKNQGHVNNSRIVWEHTRGSYKCMQCSFSTATRDQMDKHIEEVHKNPTSTRLQDEIDYNLDLLSYHSKLPSEMEPSLLPQV